ncbi:MAG: threonyl-tRNA synthetase [Solirubrobacteraceae bacterium]|nr:threonyl-tRNA synthetase [Solirubrobacteraceae bacterium]
MNVTLPDGTPLELPDGATGADAAAAIGPGLARAALAVVQDGEVRDLNRPLAEGPIQIVTKKSPEALALIRHDTAHVLATAALELFPGVKISIGPAIENGFYYDFEFPDSTPLTEDDLPRLEAKMAEHVKADEPFERSDVTVEEALEIFRAQDQPYKVELIEDLVANADPAHPVTHVSLYRNGPFLDLCKGPHAPSTGSIGAYKLQSLAGAYWRGDSDRQQLTRVYGTAFLDKKELAAHLENLELAKERDHRRVGPQLGLFTFSEVSPGAAFWLPKGTVVFNALVALNRSMQSERGYVEVKTPQIYDASLYETSGHWGKYKENIFTIEYEDREFGVKPMNCPGHAHLFGLQRWSYKDLPYRCAEPGLLHRREPSGTLHGLMRVRHFCQDDAHIFCREDQIQDEVKGCLDFAMDLYGMFGMEPRLELSTRPDPDKRLGDDAFWDRTEAMLAEALAAGGYEYKIAAGEGAFYAPKIDLHFTDSLGRSWQLGTVQLDYNLPERFGLEYTGEDNAQHRPVMIHRALFGSFERFIGVLLEHTGGELPFWLAPVQAVVLPISDRHAEAGHAAAQTLRAAGVRIEVDDRTESVGRKIRDAELQKIPLMLVVGDREAQDGTVSVRRHREGDEGSVAVAQLAADLAPQLDPGYS